MRGWRRDTVAVAPCSPTMCFDCVIAKEKELVVMLAENWRPWTHARMCRCHVYETTLFEEGTGKRRPLPAC